MSALIEVDGYTKVYANHTAVTDLNFKLQAGDILGLVGPNGAGKSTTLASLAAISPPTSGRMRIAGYDTVTDALDAKRITGFVPDEPPLFEELSIDDHLRFTASLYGVTDYERQRDGLLESFALQHKLHERTRALSRGMRQKTAICCAYLHDPKVLLFDEPMIGLDPAGMREISRSIRHRAQQGAAIIVSSHMLHLVQDLCTRVLILHEGVTGWYGSPEDLAGVTALEELFFDITDQSGAG